MRDQLKISTRNAAGRTDALIIMLIVIGIAMTAIFIFLFLNIVRQSEDHVQKIRKTNVAYSEALQWRSANDAVDKMILSDLKHDPMRVRAAYARLEMSERGMESISRMSKLRELILSESTVEDKHLKYLEKLPLTYLNLFGTKISDQGMSSISKIRTLEVLSLGATEVTDVGIKKLVDLKKLRIVDLSATAVTDSGIDALSALSELNKLTLADTHITETGLRALCKLSQLTLLDLGGVKATPAKMQALGELKNLNAIVLLRSELNDASIKSLNNLDLTIMELSKNPFTDSGLRHLKNFRKLKDLRILECPNISSKAVSEITKVLPNCKISYSKEFVQPGPIKLDF